MEKIIAPYQNNLLNDVEPFNDIMSIEVSETPSRSYIMTIDDIDFAKHSLYKNNKVFYR